MGRGNQRKMGLVRQKREGVGGNAAQAEVAVLPDAAARTAHDCEGAGIHQAPGAGAHHSDAALQLGLRVLQRV